MFLHVPSPDAACFVEEFVEERCSQQVDGKCLVLPSSILVYNTITRDARRVGLIGGGQHTSTCWVDRGRSTLVKPWVQNVVTVVDGVRDGFSWVVLQPKA